MNWARFIAAGIAAGVAIEIVYLIVGAITQLVTPYNILSLGGMGATSDPLLLLFLAAPWVLGFALVIFYCATKDAFKGTPRHKTIKLGLLAWLLHTIPHAFTSFTIFASVAYQTDFFINQICQIFGGLIGLLIAAAAIVWLMK